MARTSRGIEGYRSLGALLLVMAVLAVGVITSCGGGGGGGSDGGLCDQCGDDPDGPCQPTVLVDPNDPNAPECTRPVVTDAETGQCRVALSCRRKVDSGQRRCFPVAVFGGDVDYQFRCDGSRPGGTPRPEPTSTPGAETPTPVPTNCGNGQIEGSEECDFPDFGGESCESRSCGAGELTCTDCRIVVTSCTNATNALCER